MNFLEERILKDGIVKSGNVLKVDSFLNHQMDIALMEEIGREFKRRFGHKQVDKVLTIEASGIGIAAFVAKEFGVPLVFAKKSKSINIDGDMFVAEVESFTHKNKNQVIVSKKFIFMYSPFSIIYFTIFLATWTPLADAWDREWVIPLPSPMMYRPG